MVVRSFICYVAYARCVGRNDGALHWHSQSNPSLIFHWNFISVRFVYRCARVTIDVGDDVRTRRYAMRGCGAAHGVGVGGGGVRVVRGNRRGVFLFRRAGVCFVFVGVVVRWFRATRANVRDADAWV